MNKVFIILFLAVFVFSCNMYETKELIENGKKTIEDNNKKLEKLINLSNEMAENTCKMYKIMTSRSRDFFKFSEFYYSLQEHRVKEGDYIDISNYNKKKVWEYRPKKIITRFYFVKDLYVFFELDPYRNYNDKRAKLIYCYKKKLFKNLFSNYSFYEKDQINEIVDSLDWVYFYDDHWAITTSDPFFHKARKECLELTQ